MKILVFCPGIRWIGVRLNRSGSDILILQMYSLILRPFIVLFRWATL